MEILRIDSVRPEPSQALLYLSFICRVSFSPEREHSDNGSACLDSQRLHAMCTVTEVQQLKQRKPSGRVDCSTWLNCHSYFAEVVSPPIVLNMRTASSFACSSSVLENACGQHERHWMSRMCAGTKIVCDRAPEMSP